MWRWFFLVVVLFLFMTFPMLWTTFPDGCSDGHVHYGPNDTIDTAVQEPWHCHVPRRCGFACTPDVDCLFGGMYGPTRNGGLMLLLVIGIIGALAYSSWDGYEELDYEPVRRAAPMATGARMRHRDALKNYPIR